MRDTIKHNSWVAVHECCPMRYYLTEEGRTVDFTFGQGSNSFELGFDQESLRSFLRLGTEALAKMKHVRVK